MQMQPYKEHQMKSIIIHTFELVRSRTLAIMIAVILPAITPLAFAAAGTTWSLDATASSAQLFQGSRANPDSVNRGAARVTGRVMLDPNDLDNSAFNLSIYPADENWGRALNPDGSLQAGYVLDTSDHTLLTFKSTRIIKAQYEKLKVTGTLTVTSVERSVTMDGNEAYAGPVSGDPVVHSETREVTFVFPSLPAAVTSGPLTSVALNKPDTLDLSGAALVIHENFPELLSAIQAANWPAVVKNEHCEMPATIGDDYHGATCTGTVIAAAQNYNCQILTAPGGEGYSGPICTPPAGDQTTIALDLKMRPANGDESAVLERAGTR
jgi:polyisoprenoid-binding protein YceI